MVALVNVIVPSSLIASQSSFEDFPDIQDLYMGPKNIQDWDSNAAVDNIEINLMQFYIVFQCMCHKNQLFWSII